MNKENSDTYSVTCQCPRLLFFVLALALVFGAVCVGGVSGADVWDGNAVNQVPDWYISGVTDDDDGKGKKYTIKTAKDLAGLAYMVNSGKDDFADDTIILEKRDGLNPGERDKVTIVIWLEGDDPECVNAILGGEMKMHMDIYEEHVEEKNIQ